jgi:hypothetical protein
LHNILPSTFANCVRDEETNFPFNLETHYTSVSAAWLPDIQCWILLYSEANNTGSRPLFLTFRGPIVARFSANLIEWSPPVVIFDPTSSYGRGGFMHWPRRDTMDRDIA